MGDLVELVKVCRELDEARAEIAKLRAERERLPIETAPRDGTEIFAWIPEMWTRRGEQGDRWRVVSWLPDGPEAWVIQESEALVIVYPTHWMPLPAGPEVGRNG